MKEGCSLKEFNLIVTGVGGQGSVLASHIIAEAAVSNGLKTRVGETFGAAQRGGKVHSHVRIGENVYGPLCREKSLNILIGLEPNETLRLAIKYASSDTVIIMNTQKVLSMDANLGLDIYPEIDDIIEGLKKLSKMVIPMNATELAIEAGNERTMNVVVLGALGATGLLPFSIQDLRKAIKDRVPPRTIEINMKAFSLGIDQFNARARSL
jgi:indolepyruvate ferredoxin oxidoreductase beta subunit